MKVGIVLPTRGLLIADEEPDVRRIGRLAVRAEELGLDSVWVGDSLTAKPRLEPLSVLASVAGVTQRVRLGTSVLLAALRQPVLLAQTAATVDLISDGRLTLGIGAGGTFNAAQQSEWTAAGVPASGRGGRLTELLQLLELLWTGEPVSFEGRHYRFDDVSIGFGPKQTPRVRTLLACHAGDNRGAQYRRAARHADGLISITDSPSEFEDVRSAVLTEVAAAGRKSSEFGATFYMTVNLDPDPDEARREADLFVRRYYGLNYWQDRWGPFGDTQAVLRRALEYRAAGAGEVIFRFAATDQETQLERLAAEVLPALQQA